MGRAPCCDKSKVKRGPWSPEEDEILKNYILQNHGSASNWIALPLKAGLKRCGKSCRLRWLNYLRPDIKHGSFTPEEDEIIFTLYTKLGSRWSVIASQLQGRTDNDVKNHWNTKLKKKLMATTNAYNQQPYCSTNNYNIIDPQAAASTSTPSLAKLIPKIKTYDPMFSTNLHGHYYYYFDHQAMPSLVDVKNYKHNAMSSNTQEQGTSSVSDASQALATDNSFGITTMDFETEFYFDNIGIFE